MNIKTMRFWYYGILNNVFLDCEITEDDFLSLVQTDRMRIEYKRTDDTVTLCVIQ